MVVDVENVYITMQKEEDPDTKRVYMYVFRLLRRGIVELAKPVVEGPLGKPPFETPTIAQIVSNFLYYKFANGAQQEWQTMHELAKIFVHCVNNWSHDGPRQKRQTSASPEAFSAYKINFTRWLIFCHIPVTCESLAKYEPCAIFGRTLLRTVFKNIHRQLLDKVNCDYYKTSEARANLMAQFPV